MWYTYIVYFMLLYTAYLLAEEFLPLIPRSNILRDQYATPTQSPVIEMHSSWTKSGATAEQTASMEDNRQEFLRHDEEGF